MTASSFLSLPAELRNRVYELCSPVYGYYEEFRGLRLASRQTRAEYETECVRTMQKYLERIIKQWSYPSRLQIELPRKFTEAFNVTVQLPLSVYYPSLGAPASLHYSDEPVMHPCLYPLLGLHLSSLTITYYDDSNGLKHFEHYRIPVGILRDITSILPLEHMDPVNAPPQRADLAHRARIKFNLVGGLRLRRLIYKWLRVGQVAEYVRNVESANIGFFLRDSWWWQIPAKWGRGDDCVYFDFARVDEAR